MGTVHIVSKSGRAKSNKVKQILQRKPYHPNFDYYKQLREAITHFHALQMPKKHFANVVLSQRDYSKYQSYEVISKSYVSWCGRKKITFFEPPNGIYSRLDIDVTVNPELGLKINGTNHLVKLYFKAEPLAKSKIEIITYLMNLTLASLAPKETTMSVLDIREKKIISPIISKELAATLTAEIAYISALANAIKWDF